MDLEKLVGTKQRIYYPWLQKFIERVVRRDYQGYYMLYQGERVELKPRYNSLDEPIGFQAIHSKEF